MIDEQDLDQQAYAQGRAAIGDYLTNKISDYITKLNNEARKIGNTDIASEIAKSNSVKRLREYSVILKFLQDERKKY